MTLAIVGHNINGFCSSEPYLRKLLDEYDVVGISEHWLSGPELFKLDFSCNHYRNAKCHTDLVNRPPSKGRGYGGVSLYWN